MILNTSWMLQFPDEEFITNFSLLSFYYSLIYLPPEYFLSLSLKNHAATIGFKVF